MNAVFISYSHTPLKLKNKALKLAEKLIEAGIPTTMDHYNLKIGNDIDRFIEDVSNSEKYTHVLCLCTRDYYDKSKKLQTGVGKEIIQIEKLIRDNPYQEKVIPILFEEHTVSNDVLPEIFPKNIYWVDLRDENSLESKSLNTLIEHINGIRPIYPSFDEFQTLVYYALAEYPGLPKFLTGFIKQEVDRVIYNICLNAYNLMLTKRTWINFSREENILKKLYQEMSYFYNYMPDISLVVKTFLLIWEMHDNVPNPKASLPIIEKAIQISDSFSIDRNYPYRQLELKYKKGITLHRLDRLQEALNLYLDILLEENQDILENHRPDYIFNSALYAAHIYMIQNNIPEADKLYEQVIKSCNEAFRLEMSENLRLEIQNILYCSLYSKPIKIEEQIKQLKELEIVQDEELLWYKTLCKSYYPRLFGLRMILVPSKKPEIDGWIEGIHFKYM